MFPLDCKSQQDLMLLIMTKLLAGVSVSSSATNIVILKKKSDGFVFVSQATIQKPEGDSAAAYGVVYEQFKDLLSQSKIECTCVKASALSQGGMKLAHLEAAELRGVALAAAASVGEVRCVSKATTSRTFGKRKVDEYIKDDTFWDGLGLNSTTLKKGMREAAFTVISQFS